MGRPGTRFRARDKLSDAWSRRKDFDDAWAVSVTDGQARPWLVLASASPRRLALLRQVGLEPDEIVPAEIDEAPRPRELPRNLARRLAREKCEVACRLAPSDAPEHRYVLAADTVVAVGRRILPKAETLDDAAECLRLLSGRNHRVFTALCLVAPGDRVRERLVESRVAFKRLSAPETEAYLESGEWCGKAGGYAIQGLASAFVRAIVGSYPAIVGLPLHETASLLGGEGYPVLNGWSRDAGQAPER